MKWTVHFFIHNQQVWEERRKAESDNGAVGLTAYAARKVAIWGWMAQDANSSFMKANSSYVTSLQ
jgi:hypothetical protein